MGVRPLYLEVQAREEYAPPLILIFLDAVVGGNLLQSELASWGTVSFRLPALGEAVLSWGSLLWIAIVEVSK